MSIYYLYDALESVDVDELEWLVWSADEIKTLDYGYLLNINNVLINTEDMVVSTTNNDFHFNIDEELAYALEDTINEMWEM